VCLCKKSGLTSFFQPQLCKLDWFNQSSLMGAHLKLKVIQEQLSEVSCRINVEYESQVPSAHSATVAAVADPGRRQAQLKAEKEQKARSSVPGPIPIALRDSFWDLNYFKINDVFSGNRTWRRLSFSVTRIVHFPVGSFASPTYLIIGADKRML